MGHWGLGNRLELVGIDGHRLEQAGIYWNRLEWTGIGWNKREQAYSRIFMHIPPILAYSRLFQAIPAYTGLFQQMPVYTNLFQLIPAYYSLFQPIPAYSSLRQPIPAYSSIPNLQSPIPNLLLEMPNCAFLPERTICLLALHCKHIGRPKNLCKCAEKRGTLYTKKYIFNQITNPPPTSPTT